MQYTLRMSGNGTPLATIYWDTDMRKLKGPLFILFGTICHLALWALLIGKYIDCQGAPNCVGSGAKISGYLLGFPLDLISWIWEPSDPNHPMQSGGVILLPINSILAVSIVYWAISSYLKRRQVPKVASHN